MCVLLLFVLRRQKTLRSNISELVESIEVEEAKAEQLRKRIAASTGDTLDRQEELLRQLNKEVRYRWEGGLTSNVLVLFVCIW